MLATLSRKSDTSKAIFYALNRGDALTRYCNDGRLEIDNLPLEGALRGAAVRRRDYLSGADSGGERTAAAPPSSMRSIPRRFCAVWSRGSPSTRSIASMSGCPGTSPPSWPRRLCARGVRPSSPARPNEYETHTTLESSSECANAAIGSLRRTSLPAFAQTGSTNSVAATARPVLSSFARTGIKRTLGSSRASSNVTGSAFPWLKRLIRRTAPSAAQRRPSCSSQTAALPIPAWTVGTHKEKPPRRN
jgi:hypothetical protein